MSVLANAPPKTSQFLASFARNRARTLSDRQQELVEQLLPRISVSPAHPLPAYPHSSVAFEIGFGGGEHLIQYAKMYPDTLLIGCEPFINGVAKVLVELDEQHISNIRIFTGDARLLMEAMPKHSVQNAFMLFPDPWPKRAHLKRRLCNPQTLAMLARIQPKGAQLLLATDHADYKNAMAKELRKCPYYDWQEQEASDAAPAYWVMTKYQKKAIEQGRDAQFFCCVRNDVELCAT